MAKREKQVFTTRMVSHVWAQQTQESGRNPGGSTRFDGTALYSYATPIANFVTNKKGQRAVLITTQSYSVTTSAKHMPNSSDIPPGIPVFHVKHIGITGGRSPNPHGHKDYHAANIAAMAETYRQRAEAFSRSLAGKQPDAAYSYAGEAQAYCQFFGLRLPAKLFAPYDTLAIEKLREKFKKEASKKALKTKKRKADTYATREAQLQHYIDGELEELPRDWDRYAATDQKKRLASYHFQLWQDGKLEEIPLSAMPYLTEEQKAALAEKELQAYLADDTQRSLSWRWDGKATEQQKARYKAVANQREKAHGNRIRAQIDLYLQIPPNAPLPEEWRPYATPEQETAVDTIAIERWRKGEDSRLSCYIGATLLRIRGENIETSRGAEFPASHGVRAWPVIQACKERGETWQCNGHSVHLGHFQLDRVESDGTVKAGCHTVPFSEVEHIAKQLNLI